MIDETPPLPWMNNHGAGFCHVRSLTCPSMEHVCSIMYRATCINIMRAAMGGDFDGDLAYSQVPAPARDHHHTVNVTYTTSMSLTHQRAKL